MVFTLIMIVHILVCMDTLVAYSTIYPVAYVVAVIDKWNYLWVGNGAFAFDGTTPSVLRIDTNNNASPLRVFAMTHKTMVCANTHL